MFTVTLEEQIQTGAISIEALEATITIIQDIDPLHLTSAIQAKRKFHKANIGLTLRREHGTRKVAAGMEQQSPASIQVK